MVTRAPAVTAIAVAAMAAVTLGASAGPAAAAPAGPAPSHIAIGWWSPSAGYAPGVSPPQPGQPTHITRGRTLQLHRAVLPDAFAIVPRGVTGAQLSRLGKLRHVRGVIAVDGGGVRINGHTVSMIGADPAAFRSWTPPQTASLQAIWSAVARGRFVTAPAAARQLGLHTGKSYRIAAAHQPSVSFGGQADLGLPGVDAVVGPRLSKQLGLVHHIGVLISAPNVSVTRLDAMVRGVLGRQARLVALRQTQAAQTAKLPVGGQVTAGRPANYLELFQASAKRYCPGLSWTVLAAIGQIESGDGQNMGPSSAGALGPMQFMPGTWRIWGLDAFGQTGPPDIMNPFDAVPSAAAYLCAAGGGNPATLPRAIFAYNHAQWYVNEVLALAQEYAQEYH